MNDQLSCSVVKDLLPLYLDDALRKESKQAVAAHLETCVDCCSYQNELTHKEIPPITIQAETPETLQYSIVAKKLKKKRRIIIGIVTAVILLIILIPLPFMNLYLAGPSMEPTIAAGTSCMINKTAYLFSAPQRGDIALVSPETGLNIKRIIGLPGETIWIYNGSVYIDGEKLEEFDYGYINDPGIAAEEITLGADEYFVLGDQYSTSLDSRDEPYGLITSDQILGKLIFTGWKNIFVQTESSTAGEETN